MLCRLSYASKPIAIPLPALDQVKPIWAVKSSSIPARYDIATLFPDSRGKHSPRPRIGRTTGALMSSIIRSARGSRQGGVCQTEARTNSGLEAALPRRKSSQRAPTSRGAGRHGPRVSATASMVDGAWPSRRLFTKTKARLSRPGATARRSHGGRRASMGRVPGACDRARSGSRPARSPGRGGAERGRP